MYREFLQNFRCNLESLHLPQKPIVFSLDVRTHNLSHHLGLSSFLLSKELGDDTVPGDFERNGPRSFNQITKKKLFAVVRTLRSGLDVLLSDADIYWCKDAVKYITEVILPSHEYVDADVVIQPEAGYRVLNSGFYYVRANERTTALFEALLDNVDLGAHDQDVVNSVFCNPEHGGAKIQEPYGGVPYRCESHGVVIRVLPADLFPSGAHMYGDKGVFYMGREELKRMCDRGEFVVLHNNFIRADKKKSRFIVKGMWFLGENDDLSCGAPVKESLEARKACGRYC